MTRRPIFWMLFTALGIAGVVTAVQLFSTAFPSISVDITMDRGAAMDSAAVPPTSTGWRNCRAEPRSTAAPLISTRGGS